MEFTPQDLQVIVAGLLKLPAETSFELLLKIKTFVDNAGTTNTEQRDTE